MSDRQRPDAKIFFLVQHTYKPALLGATRINILASRIQMFAGRILQRIGMPGAVSPCLIEDPVTGQKIDVAVGTLFTRITVNGRDYYFCRFTGKFDGTGSGCGCR
jgi:hypothetical protein